MAGERPKVGLLLGDPTGIGPELVAKLLKEEDIYEWARVGQGTAGCLRWGKG